MSQMTDFTKLSQAELVAMVQQMQAAQARKLQLRVSEKGAIMLLGIRRFPVTFYVKEWQAILGMAKQIEAFAVANAGKLSQGKSED